MTSPTTTIKALRDALDIALDLANAEVEDLHQSYGDRLPHKHKRAADDVQTIKGAIAALAADASEDAPRVADRGPGKVMMSAHALCPTEQAHPDRMRWMADYFLKHYPDAARPAPVSATPAPEGFQLVPKVLRQEMDEAINRAMKLGSNQHLWDAALSTAPAAPIAEVTAIPTRGGEVEPNAYDHLREQYESIFRGPGSMASWQRKQTITGDIADEYVEMRVQFGWMTFQAGHRIASRTAAEHAKPEPVKATPAKLAEISNDSSFIAQAKLVEGLSERERFEAWLGSHGYPTDHGELMICAGGDYADEDYESMWCAWQAKGQQAGALTVKPWQDRMSSHYSAGNVRCHGADYFMAQEIADWRGQQAGAVDG